MITTDDELQRAYRAYSRQQQPSDHPAAEQLWQLAAGELESAAARAWIDHISCCPACAEDFRLTRELVAEAAGESVSSADVATGDLSTEAATADRTLLSFPQRSGVGGRWLRHFAAAAVVILVAGGLGWRLAQPDDVVYRQGEEALVQSLIAADHVAPRHDARLRWSGPEGAVYDVVVTTEALRVILEAEGLAATELSIPTAEIEELPPGTVLRWHVEAKLPDGSRFPSETFDLRLADE